VIIARNGLLGTLRKVYDSNGLKDTPIRTQTK